MVERKRDWAERGGRSSLGLPLLFYAASPLAPRMVSVYDSKKKKNERLLAVYLKVFGDVA